MRTPLLREWVDYDLYNVQVDNEDGSQVVYQVQMLDMGEWAVISVTWYPF